MVPERGNVHSPGAVIWRKRLEGRTSVEKTEINVLCSIGGGNWGVGGNFMLCALLDAY